MSLTARPLRSKVKPSRRPTVRRHDQTHQTAAFGASRPGDRIPAMVSSITPLGQQSPGIVRQNAAMTGRILYLLGGVPRVGKSTLAQRLLATDGIPWLPTDVVRTVMRRVLPELDAVDQDPVDAARLAELMYPHIQQAAEVCVEEAEQFLTEGFELAGFDNGAINCATSEARNNCRTSTWACSASKPPLQQARRVLLSRD
jgi:hypothetical protein